MRQRTVLVASEDTDSRTIIRTVLEHRGFRVVEAGDGRAGLELARAVKPDLLIREHPCRLPGGETLGAALQNDPATAAIPTLTLTTWLTPPDVEAAWRDSPAEVLAMPVGPMEVARHVERLMGIPAPGGLDRGGAGQASHGGHPRPT